MSSRIEGLLSVATRSPPMIQAMLFLLPGSLHFFGVSTAQNYHHVGLEMGTRILLRKASIDICTFG